MSKKMNINKSSKHRIDGMETEMNSGQFSNKVQQFNMEEKAREWRECVKSQLGFISIQS
jgi:hypothetical protein